MPRSLYNLILIPMLFALLASPAGAASSTKEESNAEDAKPKLVGFELGEFRIRDFRPIQGEKVRITFTVHVTTREENARGFERRLENRRMRVRDQVITAMRLADPLEFEDPQLRLIRRRLQLRLGRAMPELAIEDIFFSDFRYLVN